MPGHRCGAPFTHSEPPMESRVSAADLWRDDSPVFEAPGLIPHRAVPPHERVASPDRGNGMKISCGLAPSLAVVEHGQLAESLGYDRVWLYDSPAIYLDIWVSLARVAEHTDRIGLGTAVLVPSLRHVVATAAAIASIEGAAPGRLACGFGTGATARWTLGKDPLSLKTTGDYLRQLRGLLRGEVVEVDGEKVQMCQLPGYAPTRPIEVPHPAQCPWSQRTGAHPRGG